MKKLLLTLLLIVGLASSANAQITPPYTFTSGTAILASQVNANFAKFSDALNRTGGTITGNITVSAGVTIDGVDISELASPTTFEASSRGLVDAPAYSFTSDPDTGMWSQGTGWINWSIDGVQYMSLSTSKLAITGGLDVSGNVAVNTNKFTVDAATGNTIVAGTLNVGGAISGTATAFSGSLTGDVTSTGMATTLATVNANVGTYGDGSNVPVITVNAKGLVTAVSTASVSAGSTLPADMVAFFASTCPAGWSEYTAARGRYIVGLPASGTLAGTVGTALTDLEARAAGAHTHGGGALGVSITDPQHSHGGVATSSGDLTSATGSLDGVDGFSGTTSAASTGITADVTGSTDSAGTSTTPAPYIQLYACIKT